MYSLGTDVIAQVFVTCEPLKTLMLWCRGTYFWHRYYCADLLLANLLKHQCYGAEVPYFVFSSGMEKRTLFTHFCLMKTQLTKKVH